MDEERPNNVQPDSAVLLVLPENEFSNIQKPNVLWMRQNPISLLCVSHEQWIKIGNMIPIRSILDLQWRARSASTPPSPSWFVTREPIIRHWGLMESLNIGAWWNPSSLGLDGIVRHWGFMESFVIGACWDRLSLGLVGFNLQFSSYELSHICSHM